MQLCCCAYATGESESPQLQQATLPHKKMRDTSFYIEKVNNDAESAMIQNRKRLSEKYKAAGGRQKYKAGLVAEYAKATEKGWIEKVFRVESVNGKNKAVAKFQLRSGKQNGIGTSEVVGIFGSQSEAECHAKLISLEMF